MAKNKRLKIDMCAGSELKDTQGETLSIEGADITELMEGRGRLNDNHGKGFFNSIGRVTEAKKIFKSEDCENDRHKYYWEKIKAPYIYVAGELYNDEDHPNAKAAAAILRNIHREDTPLVMKASVEGGVMARGVSDSSRLARTKIHSVALTFTPANNATLVEPINLDKSLINWETDRQLIKSVMHLAETNVPSFRHIQRHASANTIHENINKIQELAKHLGIEVEVKTPAPETIIKNAVFHKIENNIKKINNIVKELNKSKVNFMGMTSPVNKLTSSPAMETKFNHPDFINKFNNQRLADNHPERPIVAKYINDLKNTPHPDGTNTNHNEAERLYNALLKSDQHLDKALTAGYGGAGVPTDITGGGVIQIHSLDRKRKKKIKNKLLKAAHSQFAEELIKGKKELLQMYKPENQDIGKEHVDWVTKNLPTPWHNWAVVNHRNDPKSFTPEVKETLTHFGGMNHIDDISRVRMDNSDNFESGINKLKTAEKTYNDKEHEEEKRWIFPKENQVLKVKGDKKGNRDWYDLHTPFDKAPHSSTNDKERGEGDAMIHCGNIEGRSRASDNILSLREKAKKDEKEMHKPHLTFIENNGWLGETKGFKNNKPSKQYHKDIVELLKNPDIKGIVGGGYKPQNNFKFNDLSEEHKKEVLNSNPNLISDLESSDNVEKALDNGLPSHHVVNLMHGKDLDPKLQQKILNNYRGDENKHIRQVMADRSDLDPKFHEQLVNDKHPDVRQAMAARPDLDPKFHEQLVNDNSDNVKAAMAETPNLDPKLHEKLVNDGSDYVRYVMASRPDLDPKFHEQLVNDKYADVRQVIAKKQDLDPKFHEKLVNDENKHIRQVMANRSDLDPKFHEQLVNDKNPDVRLTMASRPDLDPKSHEQLVNDNINVRLAVAERPDLDPKLHEQLVNDKDPDVRRKMAKKQDLDPKFHEQLVNDKHPYVREAMASRKDLDPKFHEQLVNDNSDNVKAEMAARPDLDTKFHKQLANDESEWTKAVIAKRPDLDPKFHEQLVNDKHPDVREAMAARPDLDPKFHEQLVNDEDEYNVKAAMAERPDLDPKLHEKLVNDGSDYVRYVMASRPDLDPKFHEQLVNDESSIRQAMAARPDLDPKFHEQLVNDKSGYDNEDDEHANGLYNGPTRQAMARRKDLDPKFHEQLVNDKYPSVRQEMANRSDLDPKLQQKLLKDRDPNVRLAMALKLRELQDMNKSDDYPYKKIKNKLLKAALLQKSIEYITCDDCGHEQVFMPHQVKCRQCRSNFSFYRLNNKK